MKNRLLPQDVHQLTIRWSNPGHYSDNETIGPLGWRHFYKQGLQMTIADWLAKGLVAYQYPHLRVDAFVPISHLVGTSRECITYVDSLIEIARELESIKDPRYRSHPSGAFLEDDYVLVGECFSGAIAIAIKLLAQRISDEESHHESWFNAIIDALALIQALKPHNAGSALHVAWTELHNKSRHIFDNITKKHPWVIEHAFALACYPFCDIGASNDVKSIINDLDAATRKKRVPSVLKSDIKACLGLLSIGNPCSIESIPRAQETKRSGSPVSLSAIDSRYLNGKLSPRYLYACAGG